MPEAEKLSASCDYILAQATDSKGNYIELVANDGQGYDGKRTIGLIKNNEWLVKMSSDTPFESIDVKGTYKLVKDNCFLYNSYILWNFENDIIRFFFPKGCNFHQISDDELQNVVELINTRPRKCLNWKTPKEVFLNECVALA